MHHYLPHYVDRESREDGRHNNWELPKLSDVMYPLFPSLSTFINTRSVLYNTQGIVPRNKVLMGYWVYELSLNLNQLYRDCSNKWKLLSSEAKI
jgi:hypothetical protein